MYIDDTIAALATPPGYGSIAVIRISGSESLSIIQKVFKPIHEISDWQSHHVYLGWIHTSGQNIDQVMVTWFKKPQSYTTEEVVEISTHGSPIIVEKILNILYQNGIRSAEPGEFTKRAFLNGRIDLSQAESIMELIHSRSEKAAQLSLHMLKGQFTSQLDQMKNQMVELIAYLEAFIDFPEEDLPAQDACEIKDRMQSIQQISQALYQSAQSSRLLNRGINIVIMGPANAGKSSLFNALIGRERAIVSPHAGTTRDFIDAEILYKGFLLRLVDTAGLRQPGHEIEKIGQEKGKAESQISDLILFVVDGSSLPDQGVLEEWKTVSKDRVILVKNKKDIIHFNSDWGRAWHGSWPEYEISVKFALGLDILMDGIINYFDKNDKLLDDKWIFNHRQISIVENIYNFIQKAFQSFFQENLSHELVVSELRAALNALEQLLGEDLSEQVLDEIFGRFCLGK